MYFGYILKIEIEFGMNSFFRILKFSSFFGYSFGLGFESGKIHNSKYQRTWFIKYLYWVRIGSNLFLVGRVWFGFLDSFYLYFLSKFEIFSIIELPNTFTIYKRFWNLSPILVVPFTHTNKKPGIFILFSNCT